MSALQSTFAESANPTTDTSNPLPALPDAHVQSPAPAVPRVPAPPSPLHVTHASIFSSPSNCSSPADTAAGDTALLSAQVIDLRRRLAECERVKDTNSDEHAIRMREALEESAALRLELQEVRDQAFEDSEALRVVHQRALDNLAAEILQLKLDADLSQSQKRCDAELLHSFEAKLADALSRLEVAQEKLLEQTTRCSRSQAREEELQFIIANQNQEISSKDISFHSSLAELQLRERELHEKIHNDSLMHEQVVADMQSQIATLATELNNSKSSVSILQSDIERLLNLSYTKPVDDSDSAAAEAEVTKLRFLLQDSSDKSVIELSKLQAECNLKEEQLSVARLELIASQAAVAEATTRESNLKLQVQSLQSQLNQNKIDIQVQKCAVSSPAVFSPGDSTVLEISSRRVADIERKYFLNHFLSFMKVHHQF